MPGRIVKGLTVTITSANQNGFATVGTSVGLYEKAHVWLAGDATVVAWAGNTAYTTGDLRKNGGLLYFCTASGTSAVSGGPTGTGSDIVDGGGTLRWDYVGVFGQSLEARITELTATTVGLRLVSVLEQPADVGLPASFARTLHSLGGHPHYGRDDMRAFSGGTINMEEQHIYRA